MNQATHKAGRANENGNVVKQKLVMLNRRFVLFTCNVYGEFGKAVKENLVTLSRRLPVFAWNVGRNRSNNDNRELRLKLEWPYVMHSSVAMQRPLVSGTWIWPRQYARWHHGYYRTRR